MNNFNETKDEQEALIELINNLKNQITHLSIENEELKKRLELYGISSNFSKPLSLTEYYLGKYLDLNETVLRSRLDKINQERNAVQKEYNKLYALEETLNKSVSLEQLNSKCETLEEEIKTLTNESNYLISEQNHQIEELINEINNELEKVSQYTKEYYGNLLQHLGKASISSTMEYFDFVISVVQNSLYDQNVEIIEKMNFVNSKVSQLEQLMKTYQNSIDQKNNQLEQLKEQITNNNLQEVSVRLDELEVIIQNYIASEKELIDLFKDIKQKHIKEICNKINYLQIMEASNKEIANEIDVLIEVDYPLVLESIDTTSNAQWKRINELEKLKNRKIELEKIQHQYEEALAEYNQLQSIYESINQNITQIEEYVTFAMKAIDSHAMYLKFYDEYMALVTSEEVLVKDIEKLELEIANLKATRREKMIDPYARPLINELNENIAIRESKVERSKALLDNTRRELEEMAKSKEETILLNVIKEKLYCEKHLPDLYNRQHELMQAIDEKYGILQDLKDSLSEYEEIENKIGELLDESDNQSRNN